MRPIRRWRHGVHGMQAVDAEATVHQYLSVAVDMHKTKFGLPNKTLNRKMVLLM